VYVYDPELNVGVNLRSMTNYANLFLPKGKVLAALQALHWEEERGLLQSWPPCAMSHMTSNRERRRMGAKTKRT